MLDTLHPYPSLDGKRVARALRTTVCRATWIDLAPSIKRCAASGIGVPSLQSEASHLGKLYSTARTLRLAYFPRLPSSQGVTAYFSRNLGRNRVRAGRALGSVSTNVE